MFDQHCCSDQIVLRFKSAATVTAIAVAVAGAPASLSAGLATLRTV